MKKTIAAILVVVIAGLASPGAFGSITRSAPTGLSIQAAGEAKKQGDSIVTDIVTFFGDVGDGLRSIFSKIF